MPNTACKVCKENFYAKPAHIIKGWGKYCSAKCHYKDSRKGENVSCKICEKQIYRNQQQLNRSKSRIYFCSKSCQTKWRNVFFSGRKNFNWKNGRWTYRNVILKNNKIPKICTLCKTRDERILAVHHVDKNNLNYSISNLSWLCHNCHRLVHCDSVEEQKFISELKNINQK